MHELVIDWHNLFISKLNLSARKPFLPNHLHINSDYYGDYEALSKFLISFSPIFFHHDLWKQIGNK